MLRGVLFFRQRYDLLGRRLAAFTDPKIGRVEKFPYDGVIGANARLAERDGSGCVAVCDAGEAKRLVLCAAQGNAS